LAHRFLAAADDVAISFAACGYACVADIRGHTAMVTAEQFTDATVKVGGSDAELTARLDAELTALGVAATGADNQETLSVRVVDDAGELVAGLTGWTWGGCGGINFVWVRADRRGQGWGTRLLAIAEAAVRARGCTRMVVSSMTFQAPAFYVRHGYVETGRTEGLPGGHADVHFLKALPGGAALADVDAAGP
jgi:GNAT superfamily N-acetyltransferase